MVTSDATLFVFILCSLNIFPVQVDDGGSSGVAELVGGRQCCSHVVSGQQKCADHKNLIRISPQSLIKDPRLQSIAISNLESAVSPCLNVSLYS